MGRGCLHFKFLHMWWSNLNLIPFWEWTWCHSFFYFRHDRNVRCCQFAGKYTHYYKKARLKRWHVCRVERHYDATFFLKCQVLSSLLFITSAEMPTLPISEGGSLFWITFLSILTPKFGNLFIFGKFCDIEVACNFKKPSNFLLEPSLFSGC